MPNAAIAREANLHKQQEDAILAGPLMPNNEFFYNSGPTNSAALGPGVGSDLADLHSAGIAPTYENLQAAAMGDPLLVDANMAAQAAQHQPIVLMSWIEWFCTLKGHEFLV